MCSTAPTTSTHLPRCPEKYSKTTLDNSFLSNAHFFMQCPNHLFLSSTHFLMQFPNHLFLSSTYSFLHAMPKSSFSLQYSFLNAMPKSSFSLLYSFLKWPNHLFPGQNTRLRRLCLAPEQLSERSVQLQQRQRAGPAPPGSPRHHQTACVPAEQSGEQISFLLGKWRARRASIFQPCKLNCLFP